MKSWLNVGEIEILQKSAVKYVIADKVMFLFASGYSFFFLEILRTTFPESSTGGPGELPAMKPTTVDSS